MTSTKLWKHVRNNPVKILGAAYDTAMAVGWLAYACILSSTSRSLESTLHHWLEPDNTTKSVGNGMLNDGVCFDGGLTMHRSKILTVAWLEAVSYIFKVIFYSQFVLHVASEYTANRRSDVVAILESDPTDDSVYNQIIESHLFTLTLLQLATLFSTVTEMWSSIVMAIVANHIKFYFRRPVCLIVFFYMLLHGASAIVIAARMFMATATCMAPTTHPAMKPKRYTDTTTRLLQVWGDYRTGQPLLEDDPL
uniref:Membrane protein ORF50 n=1 Tax=Anguillid herpesvirus 1 TaxID=150286 RepID=A0A8E5AGD5_9VIRU|nr:membrane protein ORF50 [Anguillid herpesvirus 1]